MPHEAMDYIEVCNDKCPKDGKFRSETLLVACIDHLACKLHERLQEKYKAESKGATKLAITYVDLDDSRQTIQVYPLKPKNVLKEEEYVSYFWHEVDFKILKLRLLLTLEKVEKGTAWQDIRLVASRFMLLKNTEWEYSMDSGYIDLLVEDPNEDNIATPQLIPTISYPLSGDAYLPKHIQLILPEEKRHNPRGRRSDRMQKLGMHHERLIKKVSKKKRSGVVIELFGSSNLNGPRLRQTRIDEFFKKRTSQKA